MPGLIVAIVMKKIKNNMKVNLYEKSYHKCVFLREVSKKLNLNTEIIQKDIFSLKNIETGTIMSRAFKPMPVILNLVNENFIKYKNIIFFMGSSGRKILNETLQEWDLDYEEKNIIVIEPNGISKRKKKIFSNPKIKDGSIIIVGRKKETEPFDKTEFTKEVASILGSFAQVISLIFLASR